jgi:hypothetical protein
VKGGALMCCNMRDLRWDRTREFDMLRPTQKPNNAANQDRMIRIRPAAVQASPFTSSILAPSLTSTSAMVRTDICTIKDETKENSESWHFTAGFNECSQQAPNLLCCSSLRGDERPRVAADGCFGCAVQESKIKNIRAVIFVTFQTGWNTEIM